MRLLCIKYTLWAAVWWDKLYITGNIIEYVYILYNILRLLSFVWIHLFIWMFTSLFLIDYQRFSSELFGWQNVKAVVYLLIKKLSIPDQFSKEMCYKLTDRGSLVYRLKWLPFLLLHRNPFSWYFPF